MSNNQNVKQASGGIGFMGALFLVFLVLKLTNVITWSWWFVTMPLWGPWVLVFGGFAIFAVIYGAISLAKRK